MKAKQKRWVKLPYKDTLRVGRLLRAYNLAVHSVVLPTSAHTGAESFFLHRDLPSALEKLITELENKLHGLFMEFADWKWMGECFDQYRAATKAGKKMHERKHLFDQCLEATLVKLSDRQKR